MADLSDLKPIMKLLQFYSEVDKQRQNHVRPVCLKQILAKKSHQQNTIIIILLNNELLTEYHEKETTNCSYILEAMNAH